MNKTNRERLSRDYVTRSAWIYEYRIQVRNRDTGQLATRPVHRGSYVQMTLDDLRRVQVDELLNSSWELIAIRDAYETPAIIGRPKAEFIYSPVLDQGPRVKLNTEN